MTMVIGGHDPELQDTSLNLLNRNALTARSMLGERVQDYANASRGNLVIQARDVLPPSPPFRPRRPPLCSIQPNLDEFFPASATRSQITEGCDDLPTVFSILLMPSISDRIWKGR